MNYLVALNRLPLARFLTTINITADPRCRLCHGDEETQLHLFIECPRVQALRTMAESDITRATKKVFTMSYSGVTMHEGIRSMLGHEILSIYKQCVWQVRGAVYSRSGEVNIEWELMALYRWKVGRYVKSGVG